jgi:osmotically-inducible protein OsmY
MKYTSANTGRPLKALALIFCVGTTLLLGVTGCYTGRGACKGQAQTTGGQIDDRNTSSLVSAALAADTEYKFDGVTVQTFTGTVQLSGFVDVGTQKSRAGNIAEKVPGVKAVQNNIIVKGE